MNKIPRVRISSGTEYSDALTKALSRNAFVHGNETEAFESGLKKLWNVDELALVANGFSALFLSLVALGIKGKKVLVPAMSTCFSIPNAVLASGNTPVFCPLNNETLGLDVDAASAVYNNDPFDAIVLVSHFGMPANADEFRKFNVPVIDDSAQALLTRTVVLSTADITLFSFYPTKHLNAVDGGAIIAKDPEIIARIKDLCYYNAQLVYEDAARYNSRFLNLHAAVGLVSLNNLTGVIQRLQHLSGAYYNELLKLGIDFPRSQFIAGAIPQKVIISVPVANALPYENICREHGIETAKELSSISSDNLESDQQKICGETWSLPYYEDLSQKQFDKIITALTQYAEHKKSNLS